MEFCRGQPPDYVLKEAKNTSKFFKCVGSVNSEENGQVHISRQSAYQALTEEEYEAVSALDIVSHLLNSVVLRISSFIYFFRES